MNKFYIQIGNTKSGLMSLEMTRQLMADILREARSTEENVMEKPLFYRFESSSYYPSFDEIGIATSESDVRKRVRHYVGNVDSSYASYSVESVETKTGYFVTIKDE